MGSLTDNTNTEEKLWTARDVAAYLQASQSYVYKAAERGELPCRRLGALLRFVPAQVRAWAEGTAAKKGAQLVALRKGPDSPG